MTPELEKREADLKAREAALAARELEGRREAALAFCEAAVREGKLAPAHAKGAAAALVAMETGGGTLDFGEGERPLGAWFKSFLAALPRRVDFGEAAKAGPVDAGAPLDFAAPEGYDVDAEKLAARNRALAYQAEHPGMSFIQAVKATGGSH